MTPVPPTSLWHDLLFIAVVTLILWLGCKYLREPEPRVWLRPSPMELRHVDLPEIAEL